MLFWLLYSTQRSAKAILDSQNFSQSDLAKGDPANKNELSNANYLIIPTVTDLKLYRSHQAFPMLWQ